MDWRLALMLVVFGAGRGFAVGAGLGGMLALAFGLSLLASGAAFLLVVLIVALMVALIGMIIGLWLALRTPDSDVGPVVPRLRLAMRTVAIVGAALVIGVWLSRLVLQPAASVP